MKLLAISGSLRKGSTNTALLLAAQKNSRENIEITLADPLDRIPHFNPDLDTETPPESVQVWRDELKKADGIIFSSPEYAFAIPGVLKNALDWIVSSAELYNKPVALINASPSYGGAAKAQAALIQLLGVLTAKVVDKAVLNIASVNKKIDAEGNISDPNTAIELQNCVNALAEEISMNQNSY
ncbi:NAD(P)H-dependent oxidoreductase [Leptospira langatensis]|uniref:NAD(P)H-dependent oxidoreductase n=1 Tax=Leptospira langatensis TaxID=2484983 RepID=A0A5F1ZUX1_9LEPT|nr:NAD(P)H-dependent oxidoreductase [Leptospira langatensis]TGJ98711.1 NAD(P)H-dependent oxidoreductase [Leptospira langatensis]TGL40723.1 NAD(P)H-dependent oxidoreductase [Leptospira langatensis]